MKYNIGDIVLNGRGGRDLLLIFDVSQRQLVNSSEEFYYFILTFSTKARFCKHYHDFYCRRDDSCDCFPFVLIDSLYKKKLIDHHMDANESNTW